MIQLSLFEDEETVILRHKFNELKESQNKIRKSIYARHGELQKKYDDLLNRLELIERNICQN